MWEYPPGRAEVIARLRFQSGGFYSMSRVMSDEDDHEDKAYIVGSTPLAIARDKQSVTR